MYILRTLAVVVGLLVGCGGQLRTTGAVMTLGGSGLTVATMAAEPDDLGDLVILTGAIAMTGIGLVMLIAGEATRDRESESPAPVSPPTEDELARACERWERAYRAETSPEARARLVEARPTHCRTAPRQAAP